jgi:hypothetical protein
MSLMRAIAGFFGIHHNFDFHEGLKTGAPIDAEVDNERQRYSAERYIQHLLDCENGDHTGRAEWSRFLLGMNADDYASFFGQVDALMEAGEWHTVLTPEDKERAAATSRAKRFEILQGLERRGPSGLPASLANKGLGDYQPTQDELLGLPAWPDLGDENEEGENDEEDHEEAREGQSEDDQGQEVEERERLLN